MRSLSVSVISRHRCRSSVFIISSLVVGRWSSWSRQSAVGLHCLVVNQSSVFVVFLSPRWLVVGHRHLLVSSVIVMSSVVPSVSLRSSSSLGVVASSHHWSLVIIALSFSCQFIGCRQLSVFVVSSSVHRGLRLASSVSRQSSSVFVHILIECHPYRHLLSVIFHGLCHLSCCCLESVIDRRLWSPVGVCHLWSSVVCGHPLSVVVRCLWLSIIYGCPLFVVVRCLWLSIICSCPSSVVVHHPSESVVYHRLLSVVFG